MTPSRSVMNHGAWLTLLAASALLVAVHHGSKIGEWVLKPMAAAGFCISALQHGALHSGYGLLIYLGLCLSWWGDVLLIPRSRGSFLLGIGAFALAHVAYIAAFFARGVSFTAMVAGLIVLILPALAVARWLLPRVSAPMQRPVRGYMLVISVMVACAFATTVAHGDVTLLVGAVAFYLSDLFVARDRFVTPGFDNKLWGWPLYFGAQLTLAATIAP